MPSLLDRKVSKTFCVFRTIFISIVDLSTLILIDEVVGFPLLCTPHDESRSTHRIEIEPYHPVYLFPPQHLGMSYEWTSLSQYLLLSY